MMFELPTYKAIKAFFISNFNLQYSHNIDFQSLFEPASENYDHYFKNIHQIEPLFFDFNGQKFPVFIHNDEIKLYTENGIISFDVYLNTFLFLSGWLELLSDKKDNHGRFPFEASLQKKYNFVEIPIVNIYFELIKELALKKGFKVEAKKFDSPFIFTHDIDQLRSGWYENIIYYKENFSLKSLIEIPKNIFTKVFGSKDDYLKGMQRILTIDAEQNIKAISFFIPTKSHSDADFDIQNLKFEKILAQTKIQQEIGFHPGYETFQNLQEFVKQKEKLETFFDLKITKSRQHFLRYDIKITPYIIEKAKIEKDFTLGFAEQYGFRNGIANPFYLYNFEENRAFKFLSIPLVFMDVSLTNYQEKQEPLTEERATEILNFLAEIKAKYNCNFSILFHNSVFSNAKYKGFESLYLKMLEV